MIEEKNIFWYSASLIYLTIKEDAWILSSDTSLVIFQSTEYEDAFEEALKIGYANEFSYTSATYDALKVVFHEVRTLDCVDKTLISGQEVYSYVHYYLDEDFPKPYLRDSQPRLSQPMETSLRSPPPEDAV